MGDCPESTPTPDDPQNAMKRSVIEEDDNKWLIGSKDCVNQMTAMLETIEILK